MIDKLAKSTPHQKTACNDGERLWNLRVVVEQLLENESDSDGKYDGCQYLCQYNQHKIYLKPDVSFFVFLIHYKSPYIRLLAW